MLNGTILIVHHVILKCFIRYAF